MADNILLNAPTTSGQIVATEEIAGVHVERVKVVLGAFGVDGGDVASANPMPVIIPGLVSVGNSSTATLGVSATFTGSFEEVKDYAMLTLSVFADVASATDGLVFEWSHAGVSVDRSEASSVLAGVGRAFAITVRARYFRVRYVNGTTGQATFRLGTVYHPTGSGLITKPVDASITTENFALLVQAVLAGKKLDGSFTNGSFTNDASDARGSLIVETTERAVARGQISDARSGQNHGFMAVAATTQAVVRLTPYTEPTTAAQRSIVSTSATDAAAGTGARKVRITWYDGSMNGPFTEDIIPAGLTPVNTVATTMRFIESMEVIEAGSSGSNGGVISLMTGTGGAGTVIGTISWFGAGFNQTSWAHHYVTTGKRSMVRYMTAGMQAGPAATMFLRYINPLATNPVVFAKSGGYRILAAGATAQFPLDPPLAVDGPMRIDLVVAPDSATAGIIWAGFGYYEV